MNAHKQATSYMGQAMRTAGALTVLYLLLLFILPTNKPLMSVYHLNGTGYRALLFSVALPTLIVWYAGFYAYAKLYEYASLLEGTCERESFSGLARGTRILAWSLPIWVIVTGIASSFTVSPHYLWVSSAITNYSSVALPLAAFIIISAAARKLVKRSGVQINLADTAFIMLLFAVGGIAYCFQLFRHFASISLSSSHNVFNLPLWLVIVTIIVPYLYTWYIGLLAAWDINAYGKSLSGVLYRRPFQLLVAGLVTVIFSIIVFQYVSSLVFASLPFKLNSGLVAVQLLIVLRGAGFMLIGLGISQLKRIEEI